MKNIYKKKMKKNRIFPVFLSVLLLITLYPFSVYADDGPMVPVLSYVNRDNVTSGLKYATCNNIDLYCATTITDNPVYAFIYNHEVYYVSEYSGSSSSKYIGYRWIANGNSSFSTGYQFGNVDNNTGLHYYSSSIDNTLSLPYTSYIDEFSSLDAGFAYIRSGIDNGFGYSPIKYPYTFQNGYLFVYDLGQSNSSYSFNLQSKSEEYSNIGSIPFPDTNQCYWFDNSLPEIDETNIPSSSAITIDWSKGSKTNIFGQTQDMVATISGTSLGRYLYVYNPPVHYKWSGSSNPTASEVVNYPVTIDGVSSGDNFYIYDSYARLSDFNQGGKVTGTITGETGYGSVSTDGAITVTTSEGAIFNQTSGGSTDISGANGGSLAENINGLKETLDNFLNQFVQLLSAPISHIRQLISASHEFLSEFSHFFDWLPSEVSGFVISAFIVMVAIGIFKLFL